MDRVHGEEQRRGEAREWVQEATGEREDEALELLAELEAQSPGFHGVQELFDHAHHKQAKRLVLRGDRLLSERDFQQAMKLYIESQRIVKDFEPASAGMLRVKDELARMDAVAQRQFIQAVRKFPEFRHIEVAWHAAAVLKNTPDPEDERRSNATRLGEDARIVSIAARTTPYSTRSIPSGEPARYVLEVNGGFCENHGVKAGSQVVLPKIPAKPAAARTAP